MLTEKMELNQREMGLEGRYPMAPPSVPAAVDRLARPSATASTSRTARWCRAQREALKRGLHPDWRAVRLRSCRVVAWWTHGDRHHPRPGPQHPRRHPHRHRRRRPVGPPADGEAVRHRRRRQSRRRLHGSPVRARELFMAAPFFMEDAEELQAFALEAGVVVDGVDVVAATGRRRHRACRERAATHGRASPPPPRSPSASSPSRTTDRAPSRAGRRRVRRRRRGW